MAQGSLKILVLLDVFTGLLAISPNLQRDEKCECRTWKEVYKSGLTCGKGKEFAETSSNTPLIYKMITNSSQTKMCENFFKQLDTNRCVNLNVGKDEGTWCYVDAACGRLYGGMKVPSTEYSWKVCQGHDPQLRDYTPEELYEFSKKNDLLFGGVHRMAYPGMRAGDGKLLNPDDFGDDDGEFSLGADLKKYASGDTPIWFDTNKEGRLPTMIVKGTKIYKVRNSKVHENHRPGTWTDLQCVRGCQDP